ncbi:MAG TPA: SBBP repeat-containing protein, partial [Tepidisphaeraceae bacterium]
MMLRADGVISLSRRGQLLGDAQWADAGDRMKSKRGRRNVTTATKAVIEPLERRLLLAGATFDWAFGLNVVAGESEPLSVSPKVATDGAGNVYMAGRFSGTVDFDPSAATSNLSSVGGADTFVAKFNSAGKFIWARDIGVPTPSSATVLAIAVDGAGNVYTTGEFHGTVDFDPGAGVFNLNSVSAPSAGATADIFVSKLDTNGNFVWARAMGGSGEDSGNSIAVDGSGNVYTTGGFDGFRSNNDADFDPGPARTFTLTSNGNFDAFISKLDSNGNFTWARGISGPGEALPTGIAVDAGANVYTTGKFFGTVDFDPGPGSFNLSVSDIFNSATFVSKLDSSGQFVWAHGFFANPFNGFGAAEISGAGIAADATGNVYITGFFNGGVDFGPGSFLQADFTFTDPFGPSRLDGFIVKLDKSGGFLWAHQTGGISDDGFSAIALDSLNNVYAIGSFHDTVDFDPGPETVNLTSLGFLDIIVSKFDSEGRFVRVDRMGGAQTDEGQSIAVDRAGDVYACGFFSGTADFDPGVGAFNLSSANSSEFLCQLANSPSAYQVPADGQNHELLFRQSDSNNGPRLQLFDNSNLVANGLLADTTGFAVTGAANHKNIRVTVDFGGGFFSLRDGITFDGAAGVGSDSLVIKSGSLSNVTYTATGPGSGTISLDALLIAYSNLESATTDSCAAVNRTFVSGIPGAQNIRLADDAVAANGLSTIDSNATGAFLGVTFQSPTSSFTVNAGDGDDIITALALDSTFTTALNLNGEAGNDSITGNALANRLNGGAGNDNLIGLGGNDIYLFDASVAQGADILDESGGGTDTLDFSATSKGDIAINLSNASAQIVNANLTLTLSSGSTFENVIGGAGNDTIAGNSLANTLRGGKGNDTYVFDADTPLGIDSLVETDGVDTLDFSQTTTKNIVIDLSTSSVQVVNSNLSISLSSAAAFENVIGGTLNDNFQGNSLDNTFTGGAGNDTYVFDTDLALGNDVLNESGGGVDGLDFSSTTAHAITVDLSNAAAQVVNKNLTLSLGGAATIENVIGTPLADRITANAAANRLTGGAGDDTFIFDADTQLGSDTVDESGGGVDTLDFSPTTTMPISMDLTLATQVVNSNLTLTITPVNSVENVIGGALGNVIFGTPLDNRFTVGRNNTIVGRGGNDTYVFDTDVPLGTVTLDESGGGTDTLDFSPTTTQNVAIDLSNPAAQIVNVNLTLVLQLATAFDNVIGGALNDTIIGNALNNTLAGGAGNDTYRFNADVSQASDVLDDSGGVDTLDFSSTTTQAINIDLSTAIIQSIAPNLSLTLVTPGAFENVVGTALNDRMTGNSANNRLTGGAG